MPVHGVLAQDERGRDLAVRETGGDQAQDLGLAARERGAAVGLHGNSVVEEAGERALELALIVQMRQVRVTAERDEAGIREQGREFPAATDRNRPIAAAVQHERRHRHLGQELPSVRGQIELEKLRSHTCVSRVPLVAAEGGDLVAAAMRNDEAGEHLRRERPVRANEVDERAARHVRDVVPSGVPAEEDDLAHELRVAARVARSGEAGARAGEHESRLHAHGVVDGRQRSHVELDRGLVKLAVGETGADPVVADDAVRGSELLEERPGARIVPLFLEVGHPTSAE